MSTISSSTTTTTAYTVSADTTGTLVIQTGATPTTAVTVNASGALGVGSSPSYGTSGQVLTSAGSSATPTWATASSDTVGFKNRIINGAMQIDQRNAGASYAALNNTYGSCDRWFTRSNAGGATTGKFTVQRSSTAPVGFSNSMLITSSAATSIATSSIYTVGQQIEGFNVADLNWGTANAKSITISFWVNCSLTGTFGGSLKNGDSNRSYPWSYTISSANTWEYKTVTIAGDTSGTWNTDNSVGIMTMWGLGVSSGFSNTAGAWVAGDYYSPTGATSLVSTSGATMYLAGVQIEKGSTATSFDYRPYGTEFNLCQRYYSALPDTGASNGLGAGVCLNSSNFYFVAVYPVPMRTAPSFTSTGTFQVIVTTGYTPSSVTLNAAGTTSAALVAAISGVTGGNGGFIRGGGSACSLNFSAEL